MRLIGVLTGALALGLIGMPGCGDKSGDSGTPAGGATPTDGDKPAEGGTPAGKGTESGKAPTPAPAKAVMGGDSPEDVVKKMKAAVEDENFGALCNLIEPQERDGMVVMMGLMPQLMRMMKPMLGMMFGMAGGMAGAMGDEGSEEAKKAKAEAEAKAKEAMAKLDKVIVEMDNVLKAHKLELPSMEELGVNPMAGGDPDLKDLAAKAGDKVKNVDAGKLVGDMMKAFEKFKEIMPEGQGKDSGPFEDLKKKVGAGTLTDLVTEGDKATGKVDGTPATFVKVDGRWYASGMMSKSNGGGMDEEMEEDPGDEGGEDDEGDEGMEEDDG